MISLVCSQWLTDGFERLKQFATTPLIEAQEQIKDEVMDQLNMHLNLASEITIDV